MARLDEKNVASVKKTVSVAAPTGGIKLSAYDKAAGAKFVKGGVADRAATAQGRGGTLTKVSTPVKGGQTMGGKATAAQGKGGPTMGQKAATAQGKGGPIVQAIANKLTGKPTTAAPAKTEKLKVSTFELPTVFEITGDTYNREDVLDAIQKTKSTYGEKSRMYKGLLSSLGVREQDGKLLFTGRDYKKPDLRKDAGKSYVDTAQTVLGNIPGYKRMSPSPYGPYANYDEVDEYTDNKAKNLLKMFNVKPSRNLGKDPYSTN